MQPNNYNTPMTPMQQPMQPQANSLQPQAGPMQQPVVPKKDPRTRNTIIFCSIMGSIIVFGIIGIVLLFVLGRPRGSGGSVPASEKVPTLELAQSVCEKYDGKIVDVSDARFGITSYSPDEYVLSTKVCERYSPNGDMPYPSDIYIGTKDFSYGISKLKEGKKQEYRSELEDSVVNSKSEADVSRYIVLENSDEFIKACNSVAGMLVTCVGMYKDVGFSIFSPDIDTIDNVLAELGFPDRAHIRDYKSDDSGDTGANERDIQRRDDYSMLMAAVNSYLASNNGDIDGLIKKADPNTLDAARWINSTGEDPNGDPYNIKVYSWDTWSADSVLPSGDNGSQVFVIIRANCDGIDDNGDSAPAQDAGKRSFSVYGYLEDGYYCVDSGAVR